MMSTVDLGKHWEKWGKIAALCATIAACTWAMSAELHEIDTRLISLEGQIATQWRINEQRLFVSELARMNPGLAIPDPQEIKDQ